MVKGTLVVFARAPRLGTVKRRLAAGLGDVAAQRFYRLTLEATIRRLACSGRWRTLLAVDGDDCRWPRRMRRTRQTGNGLGARMANAMRSAPPGPVVLVGSDIPEIRQRHISRAFRSLMGKDAVFGPAVDGGYWLVGVRDRVLLRGLFAGVRWSTGHALADTVANLPPGRTHALLDPLADVDDAAAFARWRACAGKR